MSSFESAPPDENQETNTSRSCAPPTEKEALPLSTYGNVSLNLASISMALAILGIAILVMGGIGGFVVLGFTFAVLGALPALIFGIIGLYQPHTRRVDSILGIVFSLFILLPFALVAIFVIVAIVLFGAHGMHGIL